MGNDNGPNDAPAQARFVTYARATRPNAWKSVERLKAACALATKDADQPPPDRNLDTGAPAPTRVASPNEVPIASPTAAAPG